MKFFCITSKMKSKEYGDLTIYWFMAGREEDLDITGLVLADPNSEHFGNHRRNVLEKFTEDEMRQVKDYIKRVHGDDVEVKDFLPFPADCRIMPLGSIGEGGGDRVVMLNEDKEYDLPFRVWGHYHIWENVGDETVQRPDPDFDITIEDGFVSSAGGEAVGMTDEEIPLQMLLDHLLKKDQKNEDIPDAPRPQG